MGRSCRRKFAEAGWQEKDGSSTYVLEVADQGIPPVRTYLSHDSACYNGCSSSGLAAVYSYATQAGTASLSGKGGSRGSVRASARPLASPHQHQQARKPPTSALPPPCAASARAWVASGDGRQRAASGRDRPAHALAATARAPCLPAPARAGAWAIVSRCVTAPATAHVRPAALGPTRRPVRRGGPPPLRSSSCRGAARAPCDADISACAAGLLPRRRKKPMAFSFLGGALRRKRFWFAGRRRSFSFQDLGFDVEVEVEQALYTPCCFGI